MKVNLLHHHAGLEPVLPDPLKGESWAKYNRNGCKGPFSVLFRMKDFRIAWNAILVYTNLVFHDPELWVTDAQWSSFLEAVTRDSVGSRAMYSGMDVVHASPLCLDLSFPERTGDPLVDYQVSERKRAPSMEVGRNLPEPQTIVDSLRVLTTRVNWSADFWDILSGTCKGYEDLVIELGMEIHLRLFDPYYLPRAGELPLVGNISLIQEGGYKLRFAANPHRVYQAAFGPLGRALFKGLRSIPQDCTFDHNSGVVKVQNWLSAGHPAVSMDLSNATDRAPLELQLAFLSRCGVHFRWIEFLQSVSRGDWYVSPSRSLPAVKLNWTVGSPLGLYPTFAAFTLWHHAVVQWAFSQCPRWSSYLPEDYPYVILGDDLVIMDREVAAMVRDHFLELGMKVSETKSLDSDFLAEFAGRVISPTSVVQGFKWKGTISDESFLSFASQFGPSVSLLLRPRHRRVLAFIADLPFPYGLGWNPYGIPLSERLTTLIERVWDAETPFRRFSSRVSRINQISYLSKTAIGAARYGWVFDALSDTSDQEAERVAKLLLPGLSHLGEAVWPNLEPVALVRGVPDEIVSSFEDILRRYSIRPNLNRKSLLEVIEDKIRRVLDASSWGHKDHLWS